MNLPDLVRNRVTLVCHSQWSWRLLGDSLHLGSSSYKAVAKGSGLSLELQSGCGEWFTFYENLIREDYLRGLAPVKKGDHIIDIGANIGAFTVLAAGKVGPNGRVHSFEPDPQVCERLRHNLRINGLENVTVHAAAVGAAPGRAVFYRHPKNAYSSLHDAVDDRVQAHEQSFPVTVLGIRDVIDMIESPCGVGMLKVDCEGSEYDIFDAIDSGSAAQIRQISMEVHSMKGRSRDQLIGRLKTLGFDVRHTYPLTAVRASGATALA